MNAVDASSVANLDRGNGHGTHADDIIPPFTDLKGLSYPGQNWNAESSQFVERGCDADNGGGFPSG